MDLSTRRADTHPLDGHDDPDLTSVLTEEIHRKKEVLRNVDERLRLAVGSRDLKAATEALELVRREGFSADDVKQLKQGEDVALDVLLLEERASTPEEEKMIDSLFSVRALKKVLPRLKGLDSSKEKAVNRAIDALLKKKREAFHRLEVWE